MKKKSVLLGNGINIQFGGKAYSNRFILSRIVFNALCDKYDSLFEGTLSGKEIENIFRGLLPTANSVLDGKYDEISMDEKEVKEAISEFKEQNSNRSKFEHYYDIPLEDWFLLLRLAFLDNPDLADIGLSPQNDSHIFACIEKSAVNKIIFYSYGEPPKTLPLIKPYEFADIKKLWKSLDADMPKYNCGKKYPNSEKAKKFFELFNVLSFDPITKDEIIKEANSIPDFIAKPLCQEAMKLIENLETPKNEDELYKQFRYISRIALREGIYPSAFYLLLIDEFSKLK